MDELNGVMEIDDIAVFEVLNNRFRHRILRELADPKSVKALAEALDVPVTRLYYHVNQLADVGLIRVTEERKVGAIVERIYQTVARTFRPGRKLLEAGGDPVEMARIASAWLLDAARVDAESMLARHFETGARDLPASLGRAHVAMTKSRAEEFGKRLQAMLDELDNDDTGEDVVDYSFSFVFAPLAGPD